MLRAKRGYCIQTNMDIIRKQLNKLEWYVMKCHKAELVDKHIDDFNKTAEDLCQVVDRFIPAVHFQKDTDSRPEEVMMGSTLRPFVFLKVRPSGLDALKQENRWHHRDCRIYHYRDRAGNEMTTTDSMMERFKDACVEYGAKFEICTPPTTDEIIKGITVKVREGAFKGLDAEVIQVHNQGDAVRFTIAVKLFGDNYAYIHDCQKQDVIISDSDTLVFSLSFVDQVEAFLLDTLRKKLREKHLPDEVTAQLRDYYRLCNATFANDRLRDRFDALMSICASLLRNTSGKSRYNKRLKLRKKALADQPATLSTQTSLAWLLAALFISTRDANYRTELKSLVSSMTVPNDSICHFLALIRKL